jgi:hypothetical protein
MLDHHDTCPWCFHICNFGIQCLTDSPVLAHGVSFFCKFGVPCLTVSPSCCTNPPNSFKVASGSVDSVTLLNGGSGYTSVPTISITSGGEGCLYPASTPPTFTAVTASGADHLLGYTVTSSGSYSLQTSLLREGGNRPIFSFHYAHRISAFNPFTRPCSSAARGNTSKLMNLAKHFPPVLMLIIHRRCSASLVLQQRQDAGRQLGVAAGPGRGL